MKKEIALIVVMSSMSMMNAMDIDLAQKKQNSTVPVAKRQEFCCRFGSAVPVCDKCFAKGILNNVLLQERTSFDEVKTTPRPSEWKRCS